MCLVNNYLSVSNDLISTPRIRCGNRDSDRSNTWIWKVKEFSAYEEDVEAWTSLDIDETFCWGEDKMKILSLEFYLCIHLLLKREESL